MLKRSILSRVHICIAIKSNMQRGWNAKMQNHQWVKLKRREQHCQQPLVISVPDTNSAAEVVSLWRVGPPTTSMKEINIMITKGKIKWGEIWTGLWAGPSVYPPKTSPPPLHASQFRSDQGTFHPSPAVSLRRRDMAVSPLPDTASHWLLPRPKIK